MNPSDSHKRLYQMRFRQLKQANPHLLKYRNKRRIQLAVKLLLFWAVIALFTGFSLEATPAAAGLGPGIGIILTLLFFRPWKYFSRRYLGEIIRIEDDDRREPKTKGGATATRYSYHTVSYIHCHVKVGEDGYAAFLLPKHYETLYRVGDTVLKISGIDTPIPLSHREKTVCLCCGAVIPTEDGCCFRCGETVIRIPDAT